MRFSQKVQCEVTFTPQSKEKRRIITLGVKRQDLREVAYLTYVAVGKWIGEKEQ